MDCDVQEAPLDPGPGEVPHPSLQSLLDAAKVRSYGRARWPNPDLPADQAGAAHGRVDRSTASFRYRPTRTLPGSAALNQPPVGSVVGPTRCKRRASAEVLEEGDLIK